MITVRNKHITHEGGYILNKAENPFNLQHVAYLSSMHPLQFVFTANVLAIESVWLRIVRIESFWPENLST